MRNSVGGRTTLRGPQHARIVTAWEKDTGTAQRPIIVLLEGGVEAHVKLLSRGGAIRHRAVARVFGTSFGFPNPGLQPNRIEMEQNRSAVNEAAKILRRKGFDVKVTISKARNAPKMISRWGTAKRFHAIVVPYAERPAWRRVIEGDLAREIERRSGIPVHAVPAARS